MKKQKVIIAVGLTIGLLYIARINSRDNPKLYIHSENDYTFEYTLVPNSLEKSVIRIPITIKGVIDENNKPVIRQLRFGQDETTDIRLYSTTLLSIEDSTANLYYANISTGTRGKRTLYYFDIRDKTGGRRASFTMPDGTPFVLKFIGEVPNYILVSHIVLLFVAAFFIVQAGISSISLIRGGSNIISTFRYFFIAALFIFLGGYIFGLGLNWYTSGTTWAGVPFGTDATDNKIQLLFVYLLFLLFSIKGSLTAQKKGRDFFPTKILGWFGMGAFVLMLFVYLLPHSIKFSEVLINSVGYSFPGLLVMFYIYGLLRSKRT